MSDERFIDFFGMELLEKDADILRDFYNNNDFLTKRRNKNMERTMKSLFRRNKLEIELKRISSISIPGETLQYFPEEICEFDALKELCVRYNKINKIPKELYNLKKLTKLGMGLNFINPLPRGISKLTELEYLDLEKTGLRQFPKEITKLKNLKTLDLSYNNWGNFSVPLEIANMKGLESLSLFDVKLKSVSKKILELGNLKNLDIRHKEMKYTLLSVVDKLQEKGVKVSYNY